MARRHGETNGMPSEAEADTYDFIVLGAGSAGCAVAGRLSESGRYRVLLLEAGPRDTNPWIHVPLGYTKVFTDPKVNWMFESEPEPTAQQPHALSAARQGAGRHELDQRHGLHARHAGRLRPVAPARLRGLGLGQRAALFQEGGESAARRRVICTAVGGPLHVSDIPHEWPLAKAAIEAAVQAGIPRNDDFNGPRQEGAGFYQFTVNNSRRWSSARAYLGAARGRENLTVTTEALVMQLRIRGPRAVGVEYRTPAGPASARAGREIVVSGGAFGSPQILLLSGLGPAEHLRAMDIPVVRDIQGVGENLQDHFNTYMSWRCTQAATLNELAGSAVRRVLAGAQYVLTRSGPLTGTGIYAGAFVRSDPRFENPDLQINMFSWSTAERKRSGIVAHPFPAFTLSPVHLRPEGRGTVRLKAPDPQAPPAIRFNIFRTEYDAAALLYGIRLCRRIVAQPALAPYVVAEVVPGPAVGDDDAALLDDVRARGVANLHPVGTCRMGHGPDAVVDPRLRVHGIAGLRVADASIMPTIVAGNTNAPSIMIGEKCAAMMLEDALAA